MFSWGVAADGRLGLSKKFNSAKNAGEKGVKVVMTPKAVVSLLGIRIVDIQCGAAHTIAREAIDFAENTSFKQLTFCAEGVWKRSELGSKALQKNMFAPKALAKQN